ncbi:unnamed protein product [Ambrosiozyma monospora]|uniref:Unnamed protein product n=1 Tax=Ambrosiozyma monospora TaxID=43982 RepID=A0A9W7DIW4_AMBMO|nr:unnamed protein product [Ambrosiozyma monospora]
MNTDIPLINQIQGKSPTQLPKDLAELLSFDKRSNKWIMEDVITEQTFEYNEILERWVPQSPNYSEYVIPKNDKKRRRSEADFLDFENDNVDNTHADEGDEEDELQAEIKRRKKAKLEEIKSLKAEQAQRNTCIYVTNLSRTTTREELERTFSKYGIIAVNLSTGEKKIKMYKDPNGRFKGDCLVEYLREESCELAISLLDGTLFNPWDGIRIKVVKATFNKQKKSEESNADKESKADPGVSKSKNTAPATDDKNETANLTTTSDKTTETESKEPTKKKKISYKEKLERKKRLDEINRKVSNWSDSDDDDQEAIEKKRLNGEKIVVLKHCFQLDEIKEDPAAILEITEDIRDGCEELGEVTNVVLYDLEPLGVVTVRFKDSDAANLCVKKMNGRYFGGQKLGVEKYDGFTKFKKTRADDIDGL